MVKLLFQVVEACFSPVRYFPERHQAWADHLEEHGRWRSDFNAVFHTFSEEAASDQVRRARAQYWGWICGF